MIYAQPGQHRTAVLTGAPAGIAADLRFRVVDPPATDVVAETAGAEEGPAGVYSIEFDAPLAAGTYLATWRNVVTGVTVVEELEVGWSTPAALAVPAGPSYATPDALRAEVEVDAVALTDAQADRLIRAAERRVDRLVGPALVLESGRKFDPAALGATYAARLQEATLVLAAAEHRSPGAFAPPRAKSVKGPDFELTDVAGAAPAAAGALREAAAILDGAGLRALTARGVA